jgi:hypothetical protein
MINQNDTKAKILSILRMKGPSLPVQIGRESGISMLFAGAFLSELASEDSLVISKMKVGGSPLYYLKGQEPMLDNFYKYLPEKEREAFLMLKQKKVLEDKKQQPAIRVALRSIKDFAFPFKKDEEIFWRFHSVGEEEVRSILEPQETKEVENEARSEVKQEAEQEKKPELETEVKKEAEIKQETKGEIKPVLEIKQETKQEIKQEIGIKKEKKERQLDIGIKSARKEKQPARTRKEKITPKQERFENPLVIEEVQKEKPKSEFVSRAISKISGKYNMIEEKSYNPREYSCIVQINSDLGPMNFLALAKDKKKISETDLKQALSEAQKIPLPALFIHNGEMSKKAKEYCEKYFSILKAEKI